MRIFCNILMLALTAMSAGAQVYLEYDEPERDFPLRQTSVQTQEADGQLTVADSLASAHPGLWRKVARTPINKSLSPRVFSGYRHLKAPLLSQTFPDPEISAEVWRDSVTTMLPIAADEPDLETRRMDSLLIAMGFIEVPAQTPSRKDLPVAFGSVTPDWLRNALSSYRFQEDFTYRMMIENPGMIEYAYWDLPVPPRLPEEDTSLHGYLKRLELPEITGAGEVATNNDIPRINWLHTFNTALQLSQAYVSGNWYQGGNSYLAFLGNLMWDVQLNNVYHPNLIFQSTLAYKLAINSTPDDQFHKYSVSQDLFQYNLKTGYKAIYNWYYSFLMQFKTQFLNSYPANSETRQAAFLSPGELNLGLGMTYSKENAAKTLKFSASISPASYNFKVCIDKKVDKAQFNIKPGRKWVNEIGSNAEVNFYAKIWGNTTYTTRLFIFTDYKLLQADWENTINFQFSKLFSTQIYAHLRYDTSADRSIAKEWKKLMLKEILSVGISYTFSTK